MRYAFKRLFSGSFYFSLRSILKLILGGKLYGASGCLGRYRRRFDTGPWRFSFCRPEAFWRLTEQWKSYRADEPSGLYRISTKFGGICFMAAGAFIALLPFLLR